MCTGVHLPTMHRHMGISLLHNPPVLLLQGKEERPISGRMHEAGCRFQVCLSQLCQLTEQVLLAEVFEKLLFE